MKAAPLLVSFSSISKYLEALPEASRAEYSTEIKYLVDKNLPPVVSAYCLAIIFGYSLNFVYALSKKQAKFYRVFDIRNGKKKRRIHSPKVALKVIQKWLGFHLASAMNFPAHIFGFVKGRSFADAAQQHIGAKWVFSVDIVNFFPSILREDVSESLTAIGYSQQASNLIADLCCLKGALAQGSPASPVLSNIYMRKMDANLLSLANKYGVKITRYADDIVFSGAGNFDSNLERDLELLFEGSKLKLNKEKRYLSRTDKGQRLKVHGLLVKDDKVSLTKSYRNRLRAYDYMLRTGKVRENDIPRISGHINFFNFIESTNHN